MKESPVKEVSFWGNVRRLAHIYFIHTQSMLLYGMLVCFGVVSIVTITEIWTMLHYQNIQDVYVLSAYGGMVWFGMVIMLFASETSQISIFPGNAMSRHIARLLVDYACCLIYVLFVGLLYLMQSAVFWLFFHGKEWIDISHMFDVRYLGVGMLHMFLLWMIFHGIMVVFLALHAKWKTPVFIAVVSSVVLVVFYLQYVHPEKMKTIWRWCSEHLIENRNIFSYFGFVVCIWLFGMLVSFLVVSTMKKCRETFGKGMIIWMGSMCWFLMIALILGTPEDEIEATESYRDSVQSAYPEMEMLSKQVLIKVPEIKEDFIEQTPMDFKCIHEKDGRNHGMVGEYFNLDYEYTYTSVSLAKQEGVPEDADLSKVARGNILYYFQLPDVQLHGQPVYRDWLEDIEKHLFPVESSDSFRMEYRGKLKTTFWNDFFPEVDRFLYPDGQEITMSDWYKQHPYRIWIYAVLSDEDYEKIWEGDN